MIRLPIGASLWLGASRLTLAVANAAPAVASQTGTATIDPGAPPSILSSSPADDATGVAVTVDPSVTFDTAVFFGTSGTITLYNVTAAAAAATFDVATDQGTGPGQVSIAGATLTLHPPADMVAGNEYAIQWTAGAVTNFSGAGVAALSDTTTLSFTTAGAGGIVFRGGKVVTQPGTASGWSTSLTDLTGGTASAPAQNSLVIACYGIASLTIRSKNITTAGYTMLAQVWANSSDQDANLNVGWKFMGPTPDTQIDFGATGSSGDPGAACILVFDGVDQTTPFDVTEVINLLTTDANPDPGAITPVTPGALGVFFGVGAAEGIANPASSDLANFFSASQVDTRDVAVGGGTLAWGGSGALDPAQWTGNPTGGGTSSAALSLALRPA